MRKMVCAVLSLVSLSACLLSSVLYFLGTLSAGSYKLILLAASIGWFIFASLWSFTSKLK